MIPLTVDNSKSGGEGGEMKVSRSRSSWRQWPLLEPQASTNQPMTSTISAVNTPNKIEKECCDASLGQTLLRRMMNA